MRNLRGNMIVVLLAFLLFTPSSLYAVLADCEEATVTAALAGASSGETIQCPATSAPYPTWSAGVTVPAGVTFIGSGKASTFIDSASFITSVVNDGSTLGNIRFNNGSAKPANNAEGWVIKNFYFGNADPLTRREWTVYNAGGVYYNGTFISMRIITDGLAGSVGVAGWGDANALGGTTGVLYIEKCVLDNSAISASTGDSNRGGRTVWRFNTFIESLVQSHGDRGDISRATRLVEAYRNTLVRNSLSEYAFWDRGGIWIVFDNACSGSVANGCRFFIDTERADLPYRGYDQGTGSEPSPGETVNGATSGATGVIYHVVTLSGTWGVDAAGRVYIQDVTGGPFQTGEDLRIGEVAFAKATSTTYDGDTWNQSYPIGSGSSWDTTPHPCSGTDFAVRDAAGVGIDTSPPSAALPAVQNDQTCAPSYFWNLTYNGTPAAFSNVNNTQYFIKEDRDYFLDTSSVAGYGNGGVGIGLYASIPVCNAGTKWMGYWATDRGSWNISNDGTGNGLLYVCDGAGTWGDGAGGSTAYFSPARYPHPLIPINEIHPNVMSGGFESGGLLSQ